MTKTAYDIILSPVVTEKTTDESQEGKIALKVATNATKTEIAAAFEEIYKTKPISVNTLNVKGKLKRFRGKLGKRDDYKKAIVTIGSANVDLAAEVK